MEGVHWIDLGQWPPALIVIADKAAYGRFARQKCGKNAHLCLPFPAKNAGSCQKMEAGPSCLFVITIGPYDCEIELASTIAHEATHAMRWIFEHVGEHSPGTETQAYLVEHIVREGLKALS